MNEDKKEVAPEGSVQEQLIGKCEHCGKINDIKLPQGIIPKYCMYCGETVTYFKKEVHLRK